MTLRTGDTERFASVLDGFDKLNIDGREIVESATTEESKERLLDRFNENRDDWNEPKAESIDDLPDFVFEEWREWLTWVSPEEALIEVLDARDREYVHNVVGRVDTTHAVTELTPKN